MPTGNESFCKTFYNENASIEAIQKSIVMKSMDYPTHEEGKHIFIKEKDLPFVVNKGMIFMMTVTASQFEIYVLEKQPVFDGKEVKHFVNTDDDFLKSRITNLYKLFTTHQLDEKYFKFNDPKHQNPQSVRYLHVISSKRQAGTLYILKEFRYTVPNSDIIPYDESRINDMKFTISGLNVIFKAPATIKEYTLLRRFNHFMRVYADIYYVPLACKRAVSGAYRVNQTTDVVLMENQRIFVDGMDDTVPSDIFLYTWIMPLPQYVSDPLFFRGKLSESTLFLQKFETGNRDRRLLSVDVTKENSQKIKVTVRMYFYGKYIEEILGYAINFKYSTKKRDQQNDKKSSFSIVKPFQDYFEYEVLNMIIGRSEKTNWLTLDLYGAKLIPTDTFAPPFDILYRPPSLDAILPKCEHPDRQLSVISPEDPVEVAFSYTLHDFSKQAYKIEYSHGTKRWICDTTKNTMGGILNDLDFHLEIITDLKRQSKLTADPLYIIKSISPEDKSVPYREMLVPGFSAEFWSDSGFKLKHNTRAPWVKRYFLDIQILEGCCVCLEYPNNLLELQCGHIICKQCYADWRETVKQRRNSEFTCPICRADVGLYEPYKFQFIGKRIDQLDYVLRQQRVAKKRTISD